MSDEDCAHMVVSRHAVGVPDPEDLTKSIVTQWWSCNSCLTKFLPVPVVAAKLSPLLEALQPEEVKK